MRPLNAPHTDQFFMHFSMLAEYMVNDSCCLYVLEAAEGERMVCTEYGTDYRWFDKDARLSEELDIVQHLTQYINSNVNIKEVSFI